MQLMNIANAIGLRPTRDDTRTPCRSILSHDLLTDISITNLIAVCNDFADWGCSAPAPHFRENRALRPVAMSIPAYRMFHPVV